MTAQEVICMGGMECARQKVFKKTDTRGRTWYAIKGGHTISATYDDVVDGTDLDMLFNVDSFSMFNGVDSIEEFENALT